MHRLLSGRVFSLVLAVWVPLFMSGAEWVVRCPTHDGTVAAPTQADAGATHAASDHGHDSAPSAPADHGAGHTCSCPGPGCCPPAVAVVPGSQLPMARIIAVHAAATVATLERFESESDHVLPFATAPPLAALAPASLPVA